MKQADAGGPSPWQLYPSRANLDKTRWRMEQGCSLIED
jgi:hypothetical protein